eukprot:m.98056 g.98056  ORF g.98056 m.98056 type:complete len:852 (-) comp12509_c0_seq1:1981-4536(-)
MPELQAVEEDGEEAMRLLSELREKVRVMLVDISGKNLQCSTINEEEAEGYEEEHNNNNYLTTTSSSSSLEEDSTHKRKDKKNKPTSIDTPTNAVTVTISNVHPGNGNGTIKKHTSSSSSSSKNEKEHNNNGSSNSKSSNRKTFLNNKPQHHRLQVEATPFQPSAGDARLLNDARELLKRLQFDVAITTQKFRYWFNEHAAKQHELDDFNAFKIKQINSAVKSEAFKNLRDIKEKKQDIAMLQLTLSKVADRVENLETESRQLQTSLEKNKSLRQIVTKRIKRERELVVPIQAELEQEKIKLESSLAAKELVMKEWEEVKAHATQAQQEHSLMKQKKSYSVDRAMQLLEEERTIAPTKDTSSEIRQGIKQALFLQNELQEKLAQLEQERSKALARVEQLQRALNEKRDISKAVGETLVTTLQQNGKRRHDFDKEEAATQQQLVNAQRIMLAKKEEVMQKDDALIAEKRKREKLKDAITSATVNKQSREAEMHRIADQYDVAMAQHDKISRELKHVEKEMNKEGDALMMDEKAAKHETRVMGKKLTSEQAWHDDIHNALEDVREKLHLMRTDRDSMLPVLQTKADAAGKKTTSLNEQNVKLKMEEEKLVAEASEWSLQHRTLRREMGEEEVNDLQAISLLEQEEKDILTVVQTLKQALSLAPQREFSERKKILAKMEMIEACKEKIEEIIATNIAKGEEVATLRLEIRHIKAETETMIQDHHNALATIEKAGVEHVQHVADLKEEMKERKMTTKRVVARNEPSIKKYNQLQNESLELRTQLVIVLQEELEQRIMFQRKQQIEAYQERHSISEAVFWKAEQINHQIQTSLKKKKEGIAIAKSVIVELEPNSSSN